MKSSAEQHDWAYNRSPLQKLEVALGGISKEEKRARALEAERKLKERMARKSAAGPPPESQERDMKPNSRATYGNDVPDRRASRKDPRLQENGGHERPNLDSQGKNNIQREPEPPRPTTSRGLPPSMHGPPARPLLESQDASNRSPDVGAVKGGSARRSVSISQPPETPRMLPREQKQANPQNSRSSSSQVPPTHQVPKSAKPAQTGASNADQPYPDTRTRAPVSRSNPQQNGHPVEPPAVAAVGDRLPAPHEIQDSGESIIPGSDENIQPSQTKSKRHTVSFNVPPPTPPPLSEWKTAPTVKLAASDFNLQQSLDVDRSKAWWEAGTRDRRESRALPKNYQKAPAPKPTCKLNLEFILEALTAND